LSRTVSARIPKELHEKLRDKCNNIGCSINDYLIGSIELCLNDYTDFDFGDEEEETEERTYKQSKEIPAVNVTKVSYDNGKTWSDLPKKDEKQKVTIHWMNNKN
jgi:predicted DNA-binding protein